MSENDHKPSAEDVSRADRRRDYGYKKGFYRDESVAADYDAHRFTSPSRRRRNKKKWAAIQAALGRTRDVRRVLDMPCGTGRFTGDLTAQGYEVFGSDISLEMLKVAQVAGEGTAAIGYVQADAEALPLAARSVDCVISIRFMLHVDKEGRRKILNEMRRVTRRWLIIDYRHRHGSRYAWWRIRWTLGLTKDPLRNRLTRDELEVELQEAGLDIIEIFPVARAMSDKWVVLAEVPPVAEDSCE